MPLKIEQVEERFIESTREFRVHVGGEDPPYPCSADTRAAHSSLLGCGYGYGKPLKTEPKKPCEACENEVNIVRPCSTEQAELQLQQQQLGIPGNIRI